MNPPPNFSWIINNELAASGYPANSRHFEYLTKLGIKVIINLRSIPDYFENLTENSILSKFLVFHFPIVDFALPSKDQIRKIIKLINKFRSLHKPILIHCLAGCGRTGTTIALYLSTLSELNFNSSDEIINYLRELRPCSLETKDQVKIVSDYFHIFNRN